jgi:hypothetical protein
MVVNFHSYKNINNILSVFGVRVFYLIFILYIITNIQTMKVIVAGGRDFSNYELLLESCNHYLQNQSEIEIVSGTANGADKLGEKYAEEKGYQIKKFPADWDKYGKSAGFKRNTEMAEYSDVLIAFWDGKSKGTSHMINTAKNKNLKVRIIKY